MTAIPSHPDSITPAWLTERLRASGLMGQGAVTAVKWEPIGTGQVGDSVRFHLTFDQAGIGPVTLAGKFPAATRPAAAQPPPLVSMPRKSAFIAN